MLAVMDHSEHIIDGLGGTTEVAQLTRTSKSTVHSWRENGIPPSRLDHIALAATARGKAQEWSILVRAGIAPSIEGGA